MFRWSQVQSHDTSLSFSASTGIHAIGVSSHEKIPSIPAPGAYIGAHHAIDVYSHEKISSITAPGSTGTDHTIGVSSREKIPHAVQPQDAATSWELNVEWNVAV